MIKTGRKARKVGRKARKVGRKERKVGRKERKVGRRDRKGGAEIAKETQRSQRRRRGHKVKLNVSFVDRCSL
jgi:hypothetical protein